MGEISVERQHLDRLLADSASTYGAPYQRAFAEIAEARRGRTAAEILPLLRRAADDALLGFTDLDVPSQGFALVTDGGEGADQAGDDQCGCFRCQATPRFVRPGGEDVFDQALGHLRCFRPQQRDQPASASFADLGR